METKLKYSEEELVSLLKSKNTSAFSTLYDNYSAALYGVVLRIVEKEEIAEDILQESFVKIWNKIDSYDHSKGKLFTWMLNIARNTAIDELRSAQHKQSQQNRNIDDSVNMINASQSTSSKVDQIGLKETVARLKPDYKLIIDLLYFKGYTQDEVSKEFQIPLGTVKTKARAAMMQLRELMNVN
ncbi:MAG: sigma-70 family RNA polymerase sigma factor [Bacteroidota bacterium]